MISFLKVSVSFFEAHVLYTCVHMSVCVCPSSTRIHFICYSHLALMIFNTSIVGVENVNRFPLYLENKTCFEVPSKERFIIEKVHAFTQKTKSSTDLG